jgi:ABC-2 type transport system ATP-binding protein
LTKSDYAIEVDDLNKSYRIFRNLRVGRGSTVNLVNFFRKLTGKGSQWVVALGGVSFKVNRGEIFGLLGPNGAGKTTIIKILSTLVLPDSGKAFVEGIDVTRRPRAVVRRLQTVLAESVGFDRRLTGRENLEFYAGLYGLSRRSAEQKIDELLKFTQMTDYGDAMFQRYSTGMMRKLLVCRALLTDASVLLFDEPTAALDPISAMEFRRLIKYDLSRRMKKTVLLATHNLWEAEQLCDRIALLRKGKIIAIGTPREIKSMVSDKVTLTFVVSNLLPEREAGIKESLLKVKDVQSVEVLDSRTENGHIKLNVEGSRGMNYSDLLERLASFKLEITSLESSQPSLEDAFLKLNKELPT